MILTDRSVVIAFMRRPTPRLLQIIQDNDAAVCGVTVAEIYAGARNRADFPRCAANLGLFQHLPIPDTIWWPLGENLFVLRSNGITVSLPDCFIATGAIENNIEVWTYDHHFVLMQTVLLQLRLFHEPP